MWTLDNQKLVVMFRDPYARFLSAYKDLGAGNSHIQNEISQFGPVNNLTFSEFTHIVKKNWNKVSRNEHFTPQTTLCRPDSHNYSFAGIVGRESDEQHFWKNVLNASHELHIHKSERPHTQTLSGNDADVILHDIYRNDYEFLWRTRLLDQEGLK